MDSVLRRWVVQPADQCTSQAATRGALSRTSVRIHTEGARGAIRNFPRWPMIVFGSPKGGRAPCYDGVPNEGRFSFAPCPAFDPLRNPKHLAQVRPWLRGLSPGRIIFDAQGRLKPESWLRSHPRAIAHVRESHRWGKVLRGDLRMPDFTEYAVYVAGPWDPRGVDTRALGPSSRDAKPEFVASNFRSSGGRNCLERPKRFFQPRTGSGSDNLGERHYLARTGRLMEVGSSINRRLLDGITC